MMITQMAAGDIMLIMSMKMMVMMNPRLIFPNSSQIGGFVLFKHNRELTSISMPSLSTVDAYFALVDNPVLESLDLLDLDHVTSFARQDDVMDYCE